MASDSAIKGEQASQVLGNPVFIEAFDGVIEGLVEAIQLAAVDDANMRNQLGLQIAAAGAFKEVLFEHIRTAELQAEQDKIDAMKKKADDKR